MGTHYTHLTLQERCTIAGLRAAGGSIAQIAAALDRSPSTIRRELKRNGSAKLVYEPAHADDLAWARRWGGSKLARQPGLRTYVLDHLAMGWSPEQVAGRLALDQASIKVCAQTIYSFIHDQMRRTNKSAWRRYLPRARSGPKPSKRLPMHTIAHRVCIHDRPEAVQTRAEPGHWEADLMHPSKSGAVILVLQERTSRFTFMAKQPGKHAKPIAKQMARWFKHLPPALRLSLTQDNGTEFFEHHRLHKLGIMTYFCDPHAPWQKGGIENFNGRLRRYIPRGTQPHSFSNKALQSLNTALNNTPRKVLGYKTPAEVFFSNLAHFKLESTSRLSSG